MSGLGSRKGDCMDMDGKERKDGNGKGEAGERRKKEKKREGKERSRRKGENIKQGTSVDYWPVTAK